MSDANLSVTGLFFFPVKSCAGIAIESGEIGRYGFRNDRRWMIVTTDGRYISQREDHRLALIRPGIEANDTLSLQAPDKTPITLEPEVGGEARALEVVIFRDRCTAVDEGDKVAQWLSWFLQSDCRLVRTGVAFQRQVESHPGTRKIDISFADASPFLLISEESLEDLNCHLDSPVPMNRFRPNIVVRGAGPYAEDRWKKIRIGSLEFAATQRCARCVITTIDQQTAIAGNEPLRTLSQYRKTEDGLMFGQYLAHQSEGRIAVADNLAVVQEWD